MTTIRGKNSGFILSTIFFTKHKKKTIFFIDETLI